MIFWSEGISIETIKTDEFASLIGLRTRVSLFCDLITKKIKFCHDISKLQIISVGRTCIEKGIKSEQFIS